ncbi:DUF5082 domain-containing protein [Butyrivibrio sp. XB500-5]|uniref:DUF5082 family protein n=1 Tax=Butyrivibrio sp. XB500-5 TaxID=2364880 RepID=UPI000EA9B319|nr:DUF5082 family protein [Butyrivibrio sp. XB500-5]RKM58585.1 DUF5082 domain-containing protein [Butyrivibrio sp. XB500-5]
MRTIEDIQDEIDRLWGKIERAEEFIRLLKEASGRISGKKDAIDTDVYRPFLAYDMTKASKWRGERERDAAELKKKINELTEDAQKSTSTLLSEIDAAIEKLEELIEEWKARIDHLEAEKDELEGMQEAQ